MEVTRAEEIAWAAGVFEGEGCVSSDGSRVILRVQMTDFDVMLRFASIMGFGRLYGPYEQRNAKDGHIRKPFWAWVAYGDAALGALELILSWLGNRRLERVYEVAGPLFPVERVWEYLATRRPELEWGLSEGEE
jgi:hypothetical protein